MGTNLETGTKPSRDGRIVLLRRLLANVELTRTSRKTDPATNELCGQLEEEFMRRLAELQGQLLEVPVANHEHTGNLD